MDPPEDTTIAPTLLLAGDGERLAPALLKSLGRRGMTVERSSKAGLAQQAYVSAPDLVVLVGDAAEDLGRGGVAELAKRRATATVPVAVVVSDPGELSERLDAFKHGVVSMIPRSASVDEMAKRIAQVATEVPGRSGELHRGLAGASIDELVELFAAELRTGILSVAAGPDDVSAQVVLHADKPVKEVVSELVDRLRPLVSHAQGPLRYEFFESASDRLGSLLEEVGDDTDLEVFSGLRLVLVEQRAARSDALVQELRALGAKVVVADGQGVGLDRAGALDPQVVMFDGKGERGWALGALRALRRDPRLRWASVLIVDDEQLWRDGDRPDLVGLAVAIAPLIAPDLELAQRAREQQRFDVRLDALGPTRLLRTLADTQLGLHLRVTHPNAVVDVDVSDGLVAGAQARLAKGGLKVARGPAALATLLALSAGRARIEQKDAPARADVMAPVDDAIAASAGETPLVAPSIPPPNHPPISAASPPAVEVPNAHGGSEMVQRLEGLIGKLSTLVEHGHSLRPSEPDTAPAIGLPPGASMASPNTTPGRALPPARTGATAVLGAPPDPGPAPPPKRHRKTKPPARKKMPTAPPPPPAAAMKPRSVPPPPPGAKLSSRPPPPGMKLPSRPPPPRPRSAPPPPPGKALASRPPPPPGKALPSRPPPRPKSAPPPPPGAALSNRQTPPSAAPSPGGTMRPPSGTGPPRRRRRVPKATLIGVGEPAARSFPPPEGRKASAPAGPRPASIPASAVITAPPAQEPDPLEAASASAFASAPPAPAVPAEMAPPALDVPELAGQLEPEPVTFEAEVEVAPVTFEAAVEPAPITFEAHAEPEAFEPALASPEPTPALLESVPPAPPKSRAPLFIGLGAAMVLMLVGGSLLAWAMFSGDAADTPTPPTATEPVPDPETPETPEPEAPEPETPEPETPEPETPEPETPETPEPETPEPETPEPAATSGRYTPLAEADPIDGSAEDPLLADLGINPVEETSRRRRRRLLRELIQRGNRHRRDGELDEAEQLYERMLELDPENARATVGLCRIAMAREEHALAVRLAQRLVRIRPQYASNFVLLGDTYEAAGDDRAALRAWTRAHDTEPRWRPAIERLQRVEESE